MTTTDVASPVSGYLARHHIDPLKVVALTGDASDRRYYRVLTRDGGTFVLAVHASPFDYDKLPFANVAELLKAMPLPVPRLIGEAADLGVLALDDLGDLTLQAHLGGAPPELRRALYQEAVSFIAILQKRGRELADPKFIPYSMAFDVEKLTWEMNFFLKHFIEGYLARPISPADREAFARAFAPIVGDLAAEDRVLCHRDYHSRNLMYSGGRLHIIDFQDARMGPDTYDLVSLLRDSYVDLTDSEVEASIDEYLRLTGRTDEGVAFRIRFDLASLQRNLKALGTFGYQTTARENPVYVQYIPRTLRYVRENLNKYDRFAQLRDLLVQYGDEFRA